MDSNKLSNKGAKSSLSSRADRQNKTTITTVRKKPLTTYKVPPLTLRLSLTDKQKVQDWVEDLQENTNRKVSAAKLFRALTSMKDDIDNNKLLELMNDM
ncbi:MULTISPECIES: hypothetical protein [Photobacterium]|uniref:Uncharacterized protein n=2 Tax=Photobacterium TaxID=657 RepID=A0A2T3M9D4_9GAMM|nr:MULTISPECIES: hypothetical protein [Photobacterium]MBY3790699.1 hypothetical protein [Photobacterium carnosum]MCD9476626.1 hypothetical protein [Photobacterium phosphoreum]MCD9496886.1 hypothetical protein [Photobacterium carnosum]MCD9516488.1 hypothetical protein [Photobacterium carnosum]MCD9524193.1 hypothetical protein [Photobacterium carnosum]